MSVPPLNPDPGHEPASDGLPLGLKIFLAMTALIVVGFIIWHLTGGGMATHGR